MALAKLDGKDGSTARALTGCALLVVEDEYLVARDISVALIANGAATVNLCPNLTGALEILEEMESINGAVIDMNLRGEDPLPVAQALQARGIGFVIATGYDGEPLPTELWDVPRCTKPIDYERLVKLLHEEIGACH